MGLFEPMWTYMELYGTVWTCMDLYWPVWACMDLLHQSNLVTSVACPVRCVQVHSCLINVAGYC
jgi:hypothetical protein